MPNSSVSKRRLSVTIDAKLIEEIDKLTNNRSQVVEEALRLWRKGKIEEQLKQSYQNRSQSDIGVEEEWAKFAQEEMEEILDIDDPRLSSSG